MKKEEKIKKEYEKTIKIYEKAIEDKDKGLAIHMFGEITAYEWVLSLFSNSKNL